MYQNSLKDIQSLGPFYQTWKNVWQMILREADFKDLIFSFTQMLIHNSIQMLRQHLNFYILDKGLPKEHPNENFEADPCSGYFRNFQKCKKKNQHDNSQCQPIWA